MFIKFYGTRGSIPISDKDFTDFGGNTTCVFISGLDEGMESIILDAGTGIRKLGKEILSGEIDMGNRINLGFTHFHLDHIQGFPFFEPAYNSTSTIRIATMGKKNIHSLKDIFSTQMQSVYFPVQLDRMGAQMEFIKYDTYELIAETGVMVNVVDVKHPGGCIAVRLQFKFNSVAFCTDIEHPAGIDEKVVKLASDVDVLIHDAQYTDEELETHKGWGHSSYSQAMEVAEHANVKNLILTHHDPDHDDSFLMKMEKKCQERFKNLILARDGYEFRI